MQWADEDAAAAEAVSALGFLQQAREPNIPNLVSITCFEQETMVSAGSCNIMFWGSEAPDVRPSGVGKHCHSTAQNSFSPCHFLYCAYQEPVTMTMIQSFSQ